MGRLTQLRYLHLTDGNRRVSYYGGSPQEVQQELTWQEAWIIVAARDIGEEDHALA